MKVPIKNVHFGQVKVLKNKGWFKLIIKHKRYFDLYFNVMKGEFKYYKKLEMQNNPYWIQLEGAEMDSYKEERFKV